MESVIVGLVVLAFAGYGLYKIFVKKETVAEAATEIKNEVVAEAKKVEEVVVPVVTAEVAKIVEEVKVVEAKIEEVAVAKYKEELAAFVETETKVAKELVAEVEKVVEEVKAVEAKVEEVVVAEVKKAADVNEDGKVNAADIKAAAKKVVTKVTKPKKTKT
jgi:hypothetical protein